MPLLLLLSSACAIQLPFNLVNQATAPAASTFLPRSAVSGIEEIEARKCLSQMKECTVFVGGDVNADVRTTYWETSAAPAASVEGLTARLVSRLRTQPMIKTGLPESLVQAVQKSGQKAPRVLLLHGADASTLEWRFLAPKLNALGVSVTAVDWWSGGWTDRKPILDRIDDKRPEAPKPWTLVQQHLHAFWRDQLDGEPVIVVGASLGGAVALDFAASHPEAVAGLVLVDAGGESYASPPAIVVSAMAGVALGVKQALAQVSARAPSEELRINNLHRDAPEWSGALGAYLQSGGYARRVGRPLIRSLTQPALVLWGDKDPILPVTDAYKFEQDLPGCVGVREVPGCGHCPQLEDPESVALHVAQFALELSHAEQR